LPKPARRDHTPNHAQERRKSATTSTRTYSYVSPSENDGALCVFPSGSNNRDSDDEPLIVLKQDGSFGSDTTQLATFRYRTRALNGSMLLYVVELSRQTRLRKIISVGREAGWVGKRVQVRDIGFGSVFGTDGTILGSGAGEAINVVGLLEEAIKRAAATVRAQNPDLEPAAAVRTAKAVGIGAVKYAALSIVRTKDYVFDYDRMLEVHGNTAPYLQYTHARIHSIIREAGTDACEASRHIDVREAPERDLALVLLAFGDLITEVERVLEFHYLSTYLFTLAQAFTKFDEGCVILGTQPQICDSRLALCVLTANVLGLGLELLGIEAPKQM
jgi:arginyl-tRNA synthetase